MYLIGLTGGIASGKTTVAERLAARGAVHIDADRLARDVVEPGTPGLDAIVAEFGAQVLRPNGSLDRARLGGVVFSNPERLEALNAITHPEIWRRTRALIDAAGERDPDAIVVYDVPLLAEARADRRLAFDLIVVVHADAATRLERMVELRGMDRDEAARRIGSQAADADRLAIADVVIDTDGTLERTLEQADALFDRARRATRGPGADGVQPDGPSVGGDL